MLLFLLLQIIPFPERTDNIMVNHQNDIEVSASGSIGQYYDGHCQKTTPETTVSTEATKHDWCSNINKSKTDYPWLSILVKNKRMRITGYSLRSGCCYYGCCCLEDNHYVACCCSPYSWSLQGSNDNKTWVEIHRVEKDNKFYNCQNRTYDVKTDKEFSFIRIIQNEPWPGCEFCLCINKFEVYGTTVNGDYMIEKDFDDDESVSIIGKIKTNE